MTVLLRVLVATPAHSELSTPLLYQSESPLPPGTLVRVPLGKRETSGLVWDAAPPEATAPTTSAIRPIRATLDGIAPLNAAWRRVVAFCAKYYQRSLGEIALAALPPQLRELDPVQWQRRLQRASAAPLPAPLAVQAPSSLTAEQTAVLTQIEHNSGPFLLFGATGSGKTEVYLQATERLLAHDAYAQVLVLVPEINLTPQLEHRFTERFAPLYGAHAVATLHSAMTPAQRLKNWLAAHRGQARVVLGTRLAIFASLARLRLIVVDEEHDPSYKSQEGARYSARDLAVYRAQAENELSDVPQYCKVILGSATPSLESWHLSRPVEFGGRYQRLSMPSRVGQTAQLPAVQLINMREQPPHTLVSAALMQTIAERIERGEQSLILLNRRGYAPLLRCPSCDWKSECPRCSAYRVFHKIDRSLRCHHCGLASPVPRACPQCGDPDLSLLGRGTEHLQEQLIEQLTPLRRSDGQPVHVARLDADSTRLKGTLQQQLAQVHAGEVNVLVGTQMIAKGHDFRHITLVAAVNPDGALFSADYRAPERLFSLLLQAAGRAGRDAQHSARSQVLIQTEHPRHPLYAALQRYDYPLFAAQTLVEREQAGMPPFSFQAILRAEARTQDAAQAFLRLACACAQDRHLAEAVQLYAPVPMTVQKVANVERAQLLVESHSRAALQRFLTQWHDSLHQAKHDPVCKGLLRWAIDVDPLSI